MRVRKTDAGGQGGMNTRELTALLLFFPFFFSFFSLAELKFVAFWAEKITFILIGCPSLKV